MVTSFGRDVSMSIFSPKLLLMPTKLITLALATALFLLACNSSENQKAIAITEADQTTAVDQLPTEQDPPAIPNSGSATTDSSKQPPQLAKNQPSWDKKIIRTASLTLEVKSVKDFNTSLRSKLEKHGAYTATEENIFTTDRSAMEMTIKVPVLQFEDLMNDLAGKDSKVIERSVKSEDVTAQMVDVKSRLQAKREIRLRYLDMLKQSKNMAEILQVQTEINNIQEEIEVANARIQFLGNQSAYSTINLNFYEPLPGFKPTNEFPSFLTNVLEALANGASILKTIILGLVTIWPLLLLILIGQLVWRNRNGRKIIKPTV